MNVLERIGEQPAESIVHDGVAHLLPPPCSGREVGRAAHDLRAGADRHTGIPEHNGLRRFYDRLHARTAEPVDGVRWHFLQQAGPRSRRCARHKHRAALCG